jgi:hypothetical protein
MPIRAIDVEGNPTIRQSEQQSDGGYSGANIYTTATGMGGAPINPAYVPPSYSNNGGIKINLIADSVVSFNEDKTAVGIGKSVILNRNYYSFGTQKTYQAVIKGKQSKNYFVVQIEKTFSNSADYNTTNTQTDGVTSAPASMRTAIANTFHFTYNSTAGGATKPPSALDYLHRENILIKEYELDNEGGRRRGLVSSPKYKFKSERRVQSTAGVVDLRFEFGDAKLELDIETKSDSQKLEYEVNFSSNLQNELGDKVYLEYKIVTPSGQFLKEGSIKLSDNNNDLETIESLNAKDAEVHFKISGDIGDDYHVNFIRYSTNSPNRRPSKTKNLLSGLNFENDVFEGIGTIAKKSNIIVNDDGLSLVHGLTIKSDSITAKNIRDANNRRLPIIPTDKTTENWKEVGLEFTATAKELLSHIHIHIEFEKVITYPKPELALGGLQFEKEIKDSDTDGIFNLMFGSTNADVVNVYLTTDKIIKVEPAKGFVELSFKKDFNGVYGTKRIILVPESNEYGTGERYEVTLNFKAVNDFPSVVGILHPQTIDIPSFSDGNIEWDVEYETFAATSVDVDLILKDKTKVSLYKSLTPKGSFKINIRDLAVKFSQWNGNDNVTLIFKPYNRGGAVELIGNDYEISTQIIYPLVKLDEDIIRKSIYDAFIEKIGFQEPEKESKNLTHLVNFGNDEHVLISSWENDNWTLSEKGTDEFDNEIVTKEVKSVILKLYTPLPEGVQPNQTIWVSKLMTNPLVETIILNEQALLECPPIKGPNFDIDIDYVMGKGTDYESLDNLILSSSSSTNLIQTYLSQSNLDTATLNIEYATGEIVSGTTEYLWDNFVHFSSAGERVNNFIYKVQLIENYETLLVSASFGAQTASLAGQQEIERQKAKKSSLIQGFDGFETFLYTSSSIWSSTGSESMTWPFSSSVRLPSTNSKVINWYDRVVGLAEKYDLENQNWLINNIPQYIRVNPENENFLLFFSMVGHHFDNIYYYTKAIERSRGLGYKSEAGVADKLLYDWLKGFSWDAIPLGADSKLWDYAFGEDENGNTKEVTSSKKRSNEVWRRIINNLPYLLKHKGTRKGIYALMACYGVPSCNLSVMEFGGPEATDEFKNKVLIDNCSYAVTLNGSSKIGIGNSATKAIEIFFKPAYAQNNAYLIFKTSGGQHLIISGSTGDQYGKLKYGSLETSLLPLFNGKFTGVCISDNGSQTELTTMQTEGDRVIFYESISGSAGVPTTLFIGYDNVGFSGSVDEFRMWNTHLSSSVFRDHVFYPEMINGNHISASITDLDVRLDFEYPKQMLGGGVTRFINVAPIISLGTNSRNYYEDNNTSTGITTGRTGVPLITTNGTTFNNPIPTVWPYQFEAIDRNSLIEMPDIGVSRYSSNKVRFEEQSLISDLSPRHRATKKAIQTGPLDSNRVGLFFSPTKELNFDIAKSMGAESLNEFIGDPSDRYKPTYNKLGGLRNYYFDRIKNRNIYEYIDLVRMYERAMFDDLKKMLPARVRVTTGLLIEPHFLERSKYQYEKPTGSNNYYEGNVSSTVVTLGENDQYESTITLEWPVEAENNQYESTITFDWPVEAENEQYDGLINANDNVTPSAESENYETIIDAKFENPTITGIADDNAEKLLVQSNPYVDIGFGIYCQNGSAIRTYFDQYNRLKKERIQAYLVVEKNIKYFDKYAVLLPSGMGDSRGGFITTSSYDYETKLVIQSFDSASVATPAPSANNNIISVINVDGYLPTHHRNTSDLTTGLQNSYYKGSKNTAGTTLDGAEPVETFSTNPNTIRVNLTRDSSEPILEVE